MFNIRSIFDIVYNSVDLSKTFLSWFVNTLRSLTYSLGISMFLRYYYITSINSNLYYLPLTVRVDFLDCADYNYGFYCIVFVSQNTNRIKNIDTKSVSVNFHRHVSVHYYRHIPSKLSSNSKRVSTKLHCQRYLFGAATIYLINAKDVKIGYRNCK